VILKAVIKGCCNNDRASQEKLYKHFFPAMMRMCLRYTQDRENAMLIVNDGFLKVFKKINQFEHKGSLEGWIRRIVYHAISDYFKKESRQIKFLEFENYDKKIEPQAIGELYEQDLLSLLDQIPKTSAEVFVLYAIKGFAHKEIAEQKSISVGTSKWHLSEARKRLQLLITEQENYKINVI